MDGVPYTWDAEFAAGKLRISLKSHSKTEHGAH